VRERGTLDLCALACRNEPAAGLARALLGVRTSEEKSERAVVSAGFDTTGRNRVGVDRLREVVLAFKYARSSSVLTSPAPNLPGMSLIVHVHRPNTTAFPGSGAAALAPMVAADDEVDMGDIHHLARTAP
jgi:hypothetical protein